MATLPEVKNLKASTIDILNAIRNNATINYQNNVPEAKADAQSLKNIGSIIMSATTYQNEFLNALINRIGLVIITSKSYSNPLRIFKKGFLEYGETIEEIFVNIAKVFDYDIEKSENELYKRTIPDVRTAFHTINYRKYYRITVQEEELRRAFLNIDGVTNLVNRLIESIYTAYEYDEFLVMKYTIAKLILDGRIKVVTVPNTTDNNYKGIVAQIKSYSNKLQFMNENYNIAGVKTHTTLEDQYLIIDSDFDAHESVEVLASAFNLNKAEFLGHRVLIDSLGDLDIERLDALLGDQNGYHKFTNDELQALNKIPALLIDKNFIQIYDNANMFTSTYNELGLYWNYFYHTWKSISISPFSQAILFLPETASVTSIKILPETVTANAGQIINFTATVETNNFAPQTVNWTSNNNDVVIDRYGVAKISSEATAGTVTITATATFDPTKQATATITILGTNSSAADQE